MNKTLQANLRHVIYALSDALDLVGVDDVAHGKRVGIMAAECGRTLGLPEAEVTFLFDLGLLHDIGVSSTRVHHNLVAQFDWTESHTHAEAGHALLAGYAPLAAMALPVRYHHTHWDELSSLDLSPAVARQANLIFLVDRVDALAASHYADNTLFLHTQSIRDQIAQCSGTLFSPELVQGFLETSRSEAFWLLLEPRSVQTCLQDQLSRGTASLVSVRDLMPLAEIFACIVDAKSPFTAQHSLGVSRLARFLGEQMGISQENCDKLEIAGLLHDLGKLRVPDEILDKPGKLDPRERLIINTHSFETFQILHNLTGFEEIAPWASYHHEEPGGTGYPFHLKGEDLPLEARILRVADIFQALAQHRPYRQGLDIGRIMEFLTELEQQGRLDADIVAMIRNHPDQSMQAAVGSSGVH